MPLEHREHDDDSSAVLEQELKAPAAQEYWASRLEEFFRNEVERRRKANREKGGEPVSKREVMDAAKAGLAPKRVRALARYFVGMEQSKVQELKESGMGEVNAQARVREMLEDEGNMRKFLRSIREHTKKREEVAEVLEEDKEDKSVLNPSETRVMEALDDENENEQDTQKVERKTGVRQEDVIFKILRAVEAMQGKNKSSAELDKASLDLDHDFWLYVELFVNKLQDKKYYGAVVNKMKQYDNPDFLRDKESYLARLDSLRRKSGRNLVKGYEEAARYRRTGVRAKDARDVEKKEKEQISKRRSNIKVLPMEDDEAIAAMENAEKRNEYKQSATQLERYMRRLDGVEKGLLGFVRWLNEKVEHARKNYRGSKLKSIKWGYMEQVETVRKEARQKVAEVRRGFEEDVEKGYITARYQTVEKQIEEIEKICDVAQRILERMEPQKVQASERFAF